MAQVTFTYPDTAVPLIAAAFADTYAAEYAARARADPALTAARFAADKVDAHVRTVCRAYLTRQRQAAAEQQAQADAAAQVDAVPVTVTLA